jgi:hypothetical protein
MAFKLTGGSITKVIRLNPYKRITKGRAVQCIVNGAPNEVMVDNAGKYTYLNVNGVDYYITGVLEEGVEYTSEEYTPTNKAAKPEVEGESDEAPKAKRSRKQ